MSKIDPVAKQKIWNDRILAEKNALKKWDVNWSFLKSETSHVKNKEEDVYDPRVAMKEAGLIKSYQPKDEIREAMQSDPEIASKIELLCSQPRLKAKYFRELAPKLKYNTPMTSSQELGWYDDVDVLPTSHLTIESTH